MLEKSVKIVVNLLDNRKNIKMKKISFYSVLIILLGLVLNSCDKKEYDPVTTYVYEGIMYIHEYRHDPTPDTDTFNIYDTIAYTAELDWSNEEVLNLIHYPTGHPDNVDSFSFSHKWGHYNESEGFYFFINGGEAFGSYHGVKMPSKESYKYYNGGNHYAGTNISFVAELVRTK